MKRISHREGILRIETPEGIINIITGFHTDDKGREVTTVETIPNDRFAGERRVRCSPDCRFRMVRNKRLYRGR